VALLRKLRRLWQSLFQSRRLDAELNEELRAYLEGLVEKKMRAGNDPDAARREAMIEMGGLTQIRSEVQRVRIGAGIDQLWQDLRFACRGLRRRPSFAAVAIVTFALGIGANTAIFSVVNAALIQPLPYKDSGRLGLVWGDLSASGYPRGPLSAPELIDLRRYATGFDSFAGIWQNSAVLTGDGNPEELRIGWVTANFFRTLGANAAIGRTFEDADEGDKAVPSILLSWPVWQSRYGGDPSVIGRKIMVWGGPTTVIGVMPADFRLFFPPEASIPEDLEAWLPFSDDLARRPQRQNFLRVIARMKPGTVLAQAHEEVSQIGARIFREHAGYEGTGRKLNLVGLQSEGTREMRPRLIALLAGVAVLLLTACLNVASLLIARGASRTKETALRVAVGASHRQILRQCIVEGLVLAVLGAMVGVLFGEVSLRALVALRPAALSRIATARIDTTVLAVTGVTTLLWGLLFSLAPMIEVVRTDVIGSLLGNLRHSAGTRHRTRKALVTLQIAFSVLLLVGAGLMIRTFVAIQRLDPGYTWNRMLAFRLSAPLNLDSQAAANEFHRHLQADLAALPGVTGIGSVSHLPFDDIPNWGNPYFTFTGQDPASAPFADFRSVSPGYFEAIGAHLLEGRVFNETDTAGSQRVVIVDDLLARRSWPGQSAIGKAISVDPSVSGIASRRGWATVVGVVRHMRIRSLVEDLTDQVYFPIRQAQRATTYVVKVSGDPSAAVGPIRSRMREIAPQTPLYDMHPLEQNLLAARSGHRFTMLLAAAFAAVAVVLAFIGVFGLVSYVVNTRRFEFGVRLALGARSTDILRIVVREGLVLIAAGLIIGTTIAGTAARLLQSQLFGVGPFDIWTYLIAMAVIAAACAMASWLPGRRAAASNVMDVIRSD
jgi:predicted permease